MNLTLNRQDPTEKTQIGDLLANGTEFSHTLENRLVLIPAGTYEVSLTFSPRAAAGHLWTPNKDFKLPEVLAVPGREGIRIHAANKYDELEGCIAVGSWTGGELIFNSRKALESLMDLLEVDEIAGIKSFIEVCDPCS